MYPRQEVEIWAGVLERVDHVVWHVGAFSRLWVDPSAPQIYKDNVLGVKTEMLGIIHALEPPLPS